MTFVTIKRSLQQYIQDMVYLVLCFMMVCGAECFDTGKSTDSDFEQILDAWGTFY